MPAGWVYDNVLERVASFLNGKDDSISVVLLQSTTENNGGYLDLRRINPAQFLILIEAASSVLAEIEAEGAISFADPQSYPGFLKQFQELIDMLRAGYTLRFSK
jgi:hypothetical protein